jgi:thymidine phosphorylase
MSEHEHAPAAEAIPSACNVLKARRLGIATLQEAQIFLRKDSEVCRSEGFSAHSRVLVAFGEKEIVANLYQVTTAILHRNEAGFSDTAWQRLGLKEGDKVIVTHAPLVDSLSAVRGKVYGKRFDNTSLDPIIGDIAAGRYSDIQLAAFITACAARPLTREETMALTKAMVDVGDRIVWDRMPILDKHSVGGLPGNRTTPIVVAIVAACGLTIPKTSSRAITSPAGTADTMETMAPVDLDIPAMRKVVEREGGCVVWGGSVRLSPTDDILIRVERALDIDAEGQLVASVLSKKIAAGSTHLVVDIPVGTSAKVRSRKAADDLTDMLARVAGGFGMRLRAVVTDGMQPVGRGIGPALEAHDVLSVLQQSEDAPADLRDHALLLAGHLLELGGAVPDGHGLSVAAEMLDSGKAWEKFQRICEAQGGMRMPPVADHTQDVLAAEPGQLKAIDNRRLAKIAKLAGAPEDKAAGVFVHARLDDRIDRHRPLYTIHADSPGELDYALHYARANPDIFTIAPS